MHMIDENEEAGVKASDGNLEYAKLSLGFESEINSWGKTWSVINL